MIGENTITINQESLNEAVQEYLDKRFVLKLEVITVRPMKDGQSNIFEVLTSSKESDVKS